MNKPKNSIIELLLCMFLGWAGGHKFYLGKKKTGFLYLFTFGLFVIGWWGDLISLLQLNFGKTKGAPLSTGRKIGSYIIAFLCVMIVGGCNSNSDVEAAPTEPAMAVVATQEAPATTAEPTIESTTDSTTEPTTVPATEPTTEPTTVPTTEPAETEPEGREYVLNTSSRKFHYPSCSSADDIKASNRKDVVSTREDLINQGYDPCGRCHP